MAIEKKRVVHSGQELREILARIGGDAFFDYLFEYGMATSDDDGERAIAEFFQSEEKYLNAAVDILSEAHEIKLSGREIARIQTTMARSRSKRKSRKRVAKKSKKANRRK